MSAAVGGPGTTTEPALLDVRRERDFLAGHPAGAASIPLEELAARVHELPPRDVPVLIFDDSGCRAAEAEELLRDRGWDAAVIPVRPTLAETGPARVRLWRPNAFLAEVARLLPVGGAALDIACGSGRDAVYLATIGRRVTAVDILPDAVAMAERLAARHGVELAAAVLDTQRDPLPPGPFDVVTVFSFLQRDLFAGIREIVRPGGSVVYETFLTAHRDRYGKPRRDEHLLAAGELPSHFPGWTVRHYSEGEFAPGRITARLWAVKPPTTDP